MACRRRLYLSHDLEVRPLTFWPENEWYVEYLFVQLRAIQSEQLLVRAARPRQTYSSTSQHLPYNTKLTNNLLIKWFADGVRVESVDKSLWQSHDVLHVSKQRLHVLGGQRRRRRWWSCKERFETKLQACAVVHFRWVEFWDYFVTSLTEFLRQLLLADWRLYWCHVICCSSHTQIGFITFTTNLTLLCRSSLLLP